VPPEIIEQWVGQIRDVQEFYIPGYPDVSTYQAKPSES